MDIRHTILSGKLSKFGLSGEFASTASHIQVLATFLLLAEYTAEWALDARLLLASRAEHDHATVRRLHLLTAVVQWVLTRVAAALRTCYTVRTVQWPSTALHVGIGSHFQTTQPTLKKHSTWELKTEPTDIFQHDNKLFLLRGLSNKLQCISSDYTL